MRGEECAPEGTAHPWEGPEVAGTKGRGLEPKILGPAHLYVGLLNVYSPRVWTLHEQRSLLLQTQLPCPWKGQVTGAAGMSSAAGQGPWSEALTLPLSPVQPRPSHFLLLSLSCPYLGSRTRMPFCWGCLEEGIRSWQPGPEAIPS